MAKNKKQEQEEIRYIKVRMVEENIEKADIAEFCKEIMTIYGANVNLSRSIPDFRDGWI